MTINRKHDESEINRIREELWREQKNLSNAEQTKKVNQQAKEASEKYGFHMQSKEK
ncbi:MAG: hypothetical protein ACRCUS_07130 [Anaerovoracaceae bacterium]